jgi:3-oxoacyl-[acyl-carrier-protein] synthase-3
MDVQVHADGSRREELWIEAPCSRCEMPRITHEMIDDRPRVAEDERQAGVPLGHEKMPEVARAGARAQRRDRSTTSTCFVPHQANLRINEFVAQKLNLPPEKVVHNIEKYGNTTAASIPLALSEAVGEGRAKEGDLVLFAAFGAGFTWGAGLVRL